MRDRNGRELCDRCGGPVHRLRKYWRMGVPALAGLTFCRAECRDAAEHDLEEEG